MKAGKISDKIEYKYSFGSFPDKFVFDRYDTGFQELGVYKYGTKASSVISGSLLADNQSYLASQGAEGSGDIEVVKSSANSITVGVYDKTKGATLQPYDDRYGYEKVGEKTFVLP